MEPFVGQDGALADEVERFATEPSWRLQVETITADRQEALGRLARGEVDLVVAFPADAVPLTGSAAPPSRARRRAEPAPPRPAPSADGLDTLSPAP